jgi:hypothetical protein
MDFKKELLTTQQLNERWVKCYEHSEKAILKHPEIYKKLLSLIDEVCFGSVDIDEYYNLAIALSEYLHQMGSGTIFFNYFYEHIDPNRQGSVRFFRAICLDLADQIDGLNRWRKTRRRLSLVKF